MTGFGPISLAAGEGGGRLTGKKEVNALLRHLPHRIATIMRVFMHLHSAEASDACRDAIMGLLLVKELILVDKNAKIRAGHVRLRGLPYLQVR